jgi:hypothetical protein
MFRVWQAAFHPEKAFGAVEKFVSLLRVNSLERVHG